MTESETHRLVAWAHEMRTVHQRLRDALEIARESVEDGSVPPAPERDLLLHCWGFCTALGGHHRGEDDVLFPALVRAHPDLAAVVAYLKQDHSMIEHLIQGFRNSLDSGSDPATLLRHLDGIDAVMESHFRYEERELMEILEHLELDSDPTSALGPLA